MPHSPPKRDHLRVIKPDLVAQSIRMLRDLPPESVLTYLIVTASESLAVGKLDDIRRARVSRLAERIVKEIDKAA
jgi:hypothetical protein